MTGLFSLIASRPLLAGAGALMAALMIALIFVSAERDRLRSRIEDPDTGYIARLSAARSNAARLRSAVARCNASVDRLEAAGRARAAEAEDGVEASREIVVAARSASERLAAFEPAPESPVCAAVIETDAEIAETFAALAEEGEADR